MAKCVKGRTALGCRTRPILNEIDNSLKRLGVDYVDLYQIHRWDYETPTEETLETLNDVVRAGKALYIGASAMWAWQFQKALHVAEKLGWTRFVASINRVVAWTIGACDHPARVVNGIAGADRGTSIA